MKTIFIPGLSETKKDYPNFPIQVHNINWNNITLPTGYSVVVGFSMGAILACEVALKENVNKLILCSMTPGVETLERVKAKEIVFIMGQKETWLIKDTQRLMETVKVPCSVQILPEVGHKIGKKYLKMITNFI